MKFKALPILLVSCFCCNVLFAQIENADTLLNLLKAAITDPADANKQNELRIRLQSTDEYDKAVAYTKQAKQQAEQANHKIEAAKAENICGSIFFYQDNYDEAMKNYLASLKAGEDINDIYLQALNYHDIGRVFYNKSDYPQSLNNHMRALQLARKLDNKKLIASSLFNIGIVYEKQGNYASALDYDFQALKVSDELMDRSSIATILGNIGNVYYDQGDYEKATDYDFKALKLAEDLNDKKKIALMLNNIGMVYYDQKKYDKALDYYTRALKTNEELENKFGIMLQLGNIGVIYKEKKDYAQALKYYSKSLKIAEDLGVQGVISINLGNMGEIYILQNKFAEAEKILNKALKLSEELGDLEGKEEMLRLFSELHKKKGNAALALDYYISYTALKDSLFHIADAKKSMDAETNYQLDKKQAVEKVEKEKQVAIAAAEKRKQKITLWSVIGGSAGLLLITLLSFLLYRNKRRRAEIELNYKVSSTEIKSLRSQMNPHFIFNSLNSIDDYIHNNDIENSSSYINKFSRLMRLILEMSRKDEVPLKEDLEALKLYIQLENLRMQNKVNYVLDVSPEIDDEQTLIPPMLLQPFVENAFKHAFQGIENPCLKINISLKNEMINCIVTDNGKGRQSKQKVAFENKEKRESLGLKVTHERLDIINKVKKSKAYIAFEDLKDLDQKALGTKVELSVPATFAF